MIVFDTQLTKLNFGTACVVQFGSLWFIVVQTSAEQNKFLVRFFVSYHLHKYRLVSVIHRINAAFGVSKAFVPYKFPFSVITVKEIAFDASTTLSDTGFSYQVPSGQNGYYRISVTGNTRNSKPTGLQIRIKRSPSGPTYSFDSVTNTAGNNAISLTALHYLSSSATISLYASYETATNNPIYIALEKIG